MFHSGMTGMQAFNGAILLTICLYSFDQILEPLKTRNTGSHGARRAGKTNIPTESTKWRYMYETGRLVWEKRIVDLPRLRAIVETKLDDNKSGKDAKGGRNMLSQPPLGNSFSWQPSQFAKPAFTTNGVQNGGIIKAMNNRNQLEKAEDGSLRKDSVIHLVEGSYITDTESDVQAAREQLNLEVLMRREQRSLDEIWSSLKGQTLRNKWSDDMAGTITDIERRELNLARRKSKVSSSEEDTAVTAELAELERNIRRDRLRLFQRIANASADKWRSNCTQALNKELDALQKTNADKHAIESWILNLISPSIAKDPSNRATSLEIKETQVVLDYIDNSELLKECTGRIQDARALSRNDRELEDLMNLKMSLNIERLSHIYQLVDIEFKYHGHLDNRRSVKHEDLKEEGISAAQEVSVANFMEMMNSCDRITVIRLLQESDWIAEVALTKWYDLDTAKNHGALSPTQGAGQRGREPAAGQSSSRRSKPNGSRQVSPEETLEEAQNRLNRILSEGPSVGQDGLQNHRL